jgi:hypothetical protein
MSQRSLALLVLMVFALLPSQAFGKQFQVIDANGQIKVVHTRIAPVLMHRAFPPYLGIHVYQRSESRWRR